MNASSVRDYVWGTLLLADAERHVTAYGSETAREIQRLSRSATLRVEVARELTAPAMLPVVATLYCDAVRLRLRASRLARPTTSTEPLPEDLPVDIEGRDLDAIDALPQEECQRLVARLVTLEQRLRHETETRSLTYIHGARFGRVLAVLLALGWAIWAFVAHFTAPPNVAFHRHAVSSGGMDASTVVDGDPHKLRPVRAFGSPATFDVDLGGRYRIDKVRLTNRDDEHLDMALPIHVETADVEGEWTELGVQRLHFRTADIAGGERRARFVRVWSAAHELALNQIEVLGWFSER